MTRVIALITAPRFGPRHKNNNLLCCLILVGAMTLLAAIPGLGAVPEFALRASPNSMRVAQMVQRGGDTPPRRYPITLTARSGSKLREATLQSTVVPSQGLPAGYGWHQLANTN